MPERPWLPLTQAQLGIWFADALADARNEGSARARGTAAFTTAEVVEVDGVLDPRRLARAQAQAYGDFEQLRTRFADTADGPRQQVLDPDLATLAARLEVVEVADPDDVEAWMRAALARPLDLGSGEVTRSAVLRCGERSWWFHAAHHVVLDGYGYLQFARRTAQHYRTLPGAGPGAGPGALPGALPGAAPASLAEVVAEDLDRARTVDRDWWDSRIATFAGTTSPRGRRSALGAPHRGRAEIPAAAQEQLRSAARAHGVTLEALVSAAAATYLARLLPTTGEVRLGIPLMNRTGPRGRTVSATTVCTAMNVVPLAVSTTGTLAQTVARVAAELAAVRDGAFVRVEELTRRLRRHDAARGGPPTDLFGPTFNVLPFTSTLDFGDHRGRVRNLASGPVEDMTWSLRGAVGRGPVALEVEAHPESYGAAHTRWQVHRLAAWLETFATAALHRPDAHPRDLPLLTAHERHHVVETLNDTDHPVCLRPLPDRFVEQVRRTPDAVALRWPSDGAGPTNGRPNDDGPRWCSWTYAELDTVVGRVATSLRSAGVAHGDVVGVCLRRGPELVAAVYGAHRAGAAYLPIDPDTPPARANDMCADADVRVVLDEDGIAAALAAPASSTAPLAVAPRDPAYVLFTSGSTGRPKGVQVSHEAIANRLEWMQAAFPLAAGDVVLHKTPFTFDVSVWELFWPLQVGATMLVAGPRAHRDPRELAQLIRHGGIDVAHFVPSMLRAFLADRAACADAAGALRHLICSGEALTTDLVAGCATSLGVTPTNLYGPTEAAVDVTWHVPQPAESAGVVPIGRPVWNTRCYVLDERGEPTAVGVGGELFLAGVQLADGYVARPDLTVAAFIDAPLPERHGERWYRTGDLARWRADGVLEYLGRRDAQVKVRGQRLELGEVEAVLGAVPGVIAVGVALVGEPAHERLVARYAVADGSPTSSETLRAAAEAYLPSGLVPAVYARVATIPLTPSGKTDRRALAALPLPQAASPAAHATQEADAAPATLWTEVVLNAAAEAIGAPIASTQDFFVAGGDSLRAVRLAAALEARTGVPLRISDVFDAPSPAALATLIVERRDAGSAPGRAAAEPRPGVRPDLAPVLTLRRGNGAPLILLPPAGGLGWCYAGLLGHLPPDLPVLAVQGAALGTAGHPGAQEATWPASLAALASWQWTQIQEHVGEGPFHLAGWSIGGMCAHEVAVTARSAGHRVGAVVLLDAYPSEQWHRLRAPSPDESLRAVLRMAGVEHLAEPREPLTKQSAVALLRRSGSALAALPDPVLEASLATVRHGTALVRAGTHRHGDHDLTHLAATAPRPETWLDPAGWQAHTNGAVHRVDVLATHGELLRPPARAAVAQALALAVARAEESIGTLRESARASC